MVGVPDGLVCVICSVRTATFPRVLIFGSGLALIGSIIVAVAQDVNTQIGTKVFIGFQSLSSGS